LHCYQARAQGVGGSAWARTGVANPIVLEHLERLGRHLAWHGALMLDYFHDAVRGPAYIDANPRIGETMNATLSGLNLCAALGKVALGEAPGARSIGRSGVRTHALMMGLLAEAQASGSRWRLARLLRAAWSGRREFQQSVEELAPVRGDRQSLIPVAFLAAK